MRRDGARLRCLACQMKGGISSRVTIARRTAKATAAGYADILNIAEEKMDEMVRKRNGEQMVIVIQTLKRVRGCHHQSSTYCSIERHGNRSMHVSMGSDNHFGSWGLIGVSDKSTLLSDN